MATKYLGVNAAKAAKNIPDLIGQGQMGGKDRIEYDSFVLTADLAAGDTIDVGGVIPQGAMFTDCIVTSEALGGSCTINVGWKASATGLEAAAPTGFLAALPVSSATVARAHGSAYEGAFYGKILQEAVQPVIAENAVSTGATGRKVQVEIHYIVD